MRSIEFGKPDPSFMKRVVFKHLGAANQSVIVGPRLGHDNAVLRLDEERVLVVTSDPISIIPTIGMAKSAWLSVHLIASDFTTSGSKPQFANFDYDLPQGLDTSDLEEYLTAVDRECKRLGIAIVGGHTGSYPGSGFTVIGGGTFFGVVKKDEYLTPAMARDRDAVLITKGAAIEATAVLANAFPHTVEKNLGKKVAEKARSYLFQCSTVVDAIAAASIGIKDDGVTSMHDATEGGVLGGLRELATASGRTFTVDTSRIFVSEETIKVCSLFEIDPLKTLSEGTLILTCRPERADEIRRGLRREGIQSFDVGRVGGHPGTGLWLRSGKASPRRFSRAGRDQYWDAYARGIENNWS